MPCWSCGVRPGSARPPSCTTAPGKPLAVGSFRSPGSSPSWKCRSQPCTSCVPRCSATSLPCQSPSSTPLRIALGLAVGRPPDRFVVGLAVLGLVAEVGAKRPLVCLVDDSQWLDEATRQVLGFVGRRLLAEAVLLLFAVRETADDRLFPRLPTMTVEGLTDEDARALLMAAVPGQLDPKVRDRIVAETCGNPLRLLELPRGVSSAELADGLARPTTVDFADLEDHYARRVRSLTEPTRRLMLLAAADPTGDAILVWRAAHTLGIGLDAAASGEVRTATRDRLPGALSPSAGSLRVLWDRVCRGSPRRRLGAGRSH